MAYGYNNRDFKDVSCGFAVVFFLSMAITCGFALPFWMLYFWLKKK